MSNELQFVTDMGPVLFGIAVLTCVAALLGRAWQVLAGGAGDPRMRLAPVLGFALLVPLVAIPTQLADSTTVPLVIVAVLTALALVVTVRAGRSDGRSLRPRLRVVLELLAIAVGATLAMALQFIASGRIGIPGVGINNDLAPHLYWVIHLVEHGTVPVDVANTGYPTAPHAVFAALMRLGLGVEQAFLAFTLAVPVVTAIAATSVLRGTHVLLRIGIAVMVPFAYLSAAYFAQGAYKEAFTGALIVALGIAASSDGTGVLVPLRARIAGVVALAAGLYGVVGISGLAWPVGIVVLLALASLTRRVRLPRLTRRTIAIGVVAVLALVVIGVVLTPRIQTQVQLLRDIPRDGGNVLAHIPFLEVFGVWNSHDFRSAPADVLRTGMLAGWAALLALFAFGWWVRRRELGVPAAVVVSLGMWFLGRQVQGPYWVAKLLAVAAPAVMLLTLRASLEQATWRMRRSPLAALLTFAGLAFVLLAAASSFKVMTSASVSSLARTDELAPVRAEVGDSDVLYLGQDNFISVRMRSTHVSHLFPYSTINPIEVLPGPSKPVIMGSLVDFDSPALESLDRFEYVLTARGAYRSEPPPNFEPVLRTNAYELFRRDGETSPRTTFDGANDFATTVTCSDRASLAGTAVLRDEPVSIEPVDWRLDTGATPPVVSTNVLMGPSQELRQGVRLDAGTWELVMQYQSPVRLRVGAGDERFELPPDPDAMGNRWRVGTFEVGSDDEIVDISIYMEEPAIPRGAKGAILGEVALVRTDAARRVDASTLPCGAYVDHVERDEEATTR